MKKLLIVFGISAALAIGACETPSPASDPNNTDSTTTNTAQPDSAMSRPDTMQRQ